MAADGPVLAAVLEKEARKRCLQQAVLVPVGMAADEFPHRLVQILRELIDDSINPRPGRFRQSGGMTARSVRLTTGINGWCCFSAGAGLLVLAASRRLELGQGG
jgi:hypothetical protein